MLKMLAKPNNAKKIASIIGKSLVWSILTVRIAKFGHPREPIKNLFFIVDQFDVINQIEDDAPWSLRN